MNPFQFFKVLHWIGLVLGAGGATYVTLISKKTEADPSLLPAGAKIIPSFSDLIFLGLIFLIASGVGMTSLMGGKRFEGNLFFTLKMTVVTVILISGLFIKFYLYPRLTKLTSKQGKTSSPEFFKLQNQLKVASGLSLVAWYLAILLAVLM